MRADLRGDTLAGRRGSTRPFGGPLAASADRSFAAEADHRIANHLALLTGYLRLKAAALSSQAEAPSRESVRHLLGGVSAQICTISRLHRALSAVGVGSADLGEHLHALGADFASGLSGPTEIIEDLSPGCVVRADQILPLSRIVAEADTNVLKHACEGGQHGGSREQAQHVRTADQSWDSYCAKEYRSYDRHSRTYMGRDGARHYCQ